MPARSALRLITFALLSVVLLSAAQCRGRTGPNPKQPRQLAPIEGCSAQAAITIANPKLEIAMLVTNINAVRSSYGEAALNVDLGVEATAQIHSDDMFNRNYLTTNTKKPGVLTPREQLEKFAGYKVGRNGEQMIVLRGCAVITDVMNEITKPGYLQAMTTKKWTKIGIGLRTPGNYWTIIYATDPTKLP